MNENEAITVTLTLENDEELECAVLSIFEAEEREYIALLPLDENGDNDDGQVFLYRFIDNGEDAEPDLENIEDDQEFERVSNAFNELMEEQDFADIDLDELEAIVAAENIEVSEERLDEELQKMADSYKMEVDKLKEYMGENEKKQMKEDIAIQEAVTLIANAAVEG